MSGLVSKASGLGTSLAKYTGIGAAIGALAGGVGLGALAHAQAEAIDSSAKLSDRLGISTEALAGLDHAAGLSGVSTEALTGGLEKYLKNAAGAAGGNAKLAAGFSVLGLNAADLVNMPTDQAIGKIGDALNKIDNPAQKAAAAQAIFGKTGQALLPFLKEGSTGIGNLTEEAGALGLTFSRVDAGKVEEANDAISRAGDVAVGIMRQVVIAAAPFVTDAANAFIRFGIRAVSAVKSILPPIVNIFGRIESNVVPMVESAGTAIWSTITATWGAIWGFVGPIVSAIADWVSANWQRILSAVVGIGVSVWSSISGVFQGVWSIITTVAGGVASAWDAAMGWLGLSTTTAGATTSGVVGNIGAAWLWLEETTATVFTVVGFVLKNFVDILELGMMQAALAVVTLGNQISYVFTDVAPALLTWFGQNWANIFTDVATFTGTVLTNIGKNIWSFLTAIASWLHGDGFNFEFTGLTQGFQKTMSDLPAIAERQVGPLEQAMADQVAGMQNKLGDGLADAFTSNKAATDGISDGIAKTVAGVFASKASDESAFFEGGDNPFVKPTKLDFDTSEADAKLDKTKAKAGSMHNILAGGAEAMQLQALGSIAAPIKASAVAKATADPRVDTTNTLLKKVVDNTADDAFDVEELDI